jgi:hypothetical protein
LTYPALAIGFDGVAGRSADGWGRAVEMVDLCCTHYGV